MNFFHKITINVPNEYVLDVPYKSKQELQVGINEKINSLTRSVNELKTLELSDNSYNPDNLQRTNQVILSLEFNFDREFGDSWSYIRALEGSSEHQLIVANLFKTGSYGPINYNAAIYWLMQVSTNGPRKESQRACQQLADFNERGLGIFPDPIAANYWRNRAANLKAA